MTSFLVKIYPIFGIYFKVISKIILVLTIIMCVGLYYLLIRGVIRSEGYLSFNNGTPGLVPTIILFLLPMVPLSVTVGLDYFFWKYMPRHIEYKQRQNDVGSPSVK